MLPSSGKRTALASYTWGGWGTQNDLTQFRDVFQPDQGIFSPSYPLVPPERERVRLWDFPVGYNTIYTPRSYDPFLPPAKPANERNICRMNTHALLVTEGSYEFEVFHYPYNHDWEIAHCEFTELVSVGSFFSASIFAFTAELSKLA